MVSNTILVNLVGSAQRWRYCSSVEDLIQISLYSSFIQSKEVSNCIIQNYLLRIYQYPGNFMTELQIQIFKINFKRILLHTF